MDFKKLNLPIMVINGEQDGGECRGVLVKDLKDKKVVSVPGRGHMTAPSHPLFISSMVEWVRSHDPKK